MQKKDKMMFKIYALKDYQVNAAFIENNYEKYELNQLIEIVTKTDKGYHERIDKNKNYKLFGDIDNYKKSFDNFCDIYIKFLNEQYDIQITKEDIMYTENKNKKGSFHYSIPKYYAECKKLREIHSNLLNQYKNEFLYKGEKKMEKIIDTTIYSNHWFRLPNQSKEGDTKTKHIIMKGTMKDFIMEHIEKNAICINNKFKLDQKNIIQKKSNKANKIDIIDVKEKNTTNNSPDSFNNDNNIKIFDAILDQSGTNKNDIKKILIKDIEWTILIKFFDLCYKQCRFEIYEWWIRVGMGIKNRFGDDGFDLFRYFSQKASNPDNDIKLRTKYNSFDKDYKGEPITIKTLYYYAKEDNKKKYAKIIKLYSPFKNFDMTSTDVAKYIKLLKSNYFIWKGKELYCFNGKYWEKNDLLLRYYISNELYDFLLDMLVTCFWDIDSKKYSAMAKKVENLKTMRFKKEVIETTQEYLKNDAIEFDTKYNLFGFNNVVYDLSKGEFREYRYDDFISVTTGYDWEEPIESDIKTMNNLIKSIFPIESERNLYLEILATGLEGRCLEKFIVFNGEGGNGKGLMNDIYLKSLGNYGMIGNNAILFEKNKTGANPEREKINKKRFVVFREVPKKCKFENSVIKELTGGGQFSARDLHSSNTNQHLYLTMVVECNKRPLFAEEPERAEMRRLIDILFRVNFTDNPNEIDEANNILLANLEFKNEHFQQKHKMALLKILFDKYKNYMERKYVFDIPKSVVDRTKMYLEMSCDILGWIDEFYEKTTNKADIVKLNEMYYFFKSSEYFKNLSKQEKRSYNYKYFVKQIAENIFFKKYYKERTNDGSVGNHITNYKEK